MPREIRVTAMGTASMAPDLARIAFSLYADGATVEEAMTAVDGRRLALQSVLEREANFPA